MASLSRFWKRGVRKLSVRAAWRAGLPPRKQSLFEAVTDRLEREYAMLSVALFEGVSAHQHGLRSFAREHVGLAASLVERLSGAVAGALEALDRHGAHFGTQPPVEPLDPELFEGLAARRAAAWGAILETVLLGSRLRFHHKARVLAGLVEKLGREFRERAESLADNSALRPEADWDALDELHDDLNTCLRETIVMLKSFLVALPEVELEKLGKRLDSPLVPPARKPAPRALR